MTTSEERIEGAPTAFRLARDRASGDLREALKPAQTVISADSHIIEPADLWTERIERAYRDQAPHIENEATMPDGSHEVGQFMVVEGAPPQRVAGFAVANVDPEERAEANKRGYDQIRPGAWDPVERLKDQDIDGISAEVIYPSMTMPYFSLADSGLQQAVFRAYNDCKRRATRRSPNTSRTPRGRYPWSSWSVEARRAPSLQASRSA